MEQSRLSKNQNKEHDLLKFFLKNRSFFKRALCDGTKTRCFLTKNLNKRFFILLLASLGVSEIGDSHQMIIEIIKKNIWEVKVTTDDGHQMRKQLETYEEVTSFVEGLLAGYHPNQKKIEDYGSE